MQPLLALYYKEGVLIAKIKSDVQQEIDLVLPSDILESYTGASEIAALEYQRTGSCCERSK
jgi:hypothetical protein